MMFCPRLSLILRLENRSCCANHRQSHISCHICLSMSCAQSAYKASSVCHSTAVSTTCIRPLHLDPICRQTTFFLGKLVMVLETKRPLLLLLIAVGRFKLILPPPNPPSTQKLLSGISLGVTLVPLRKSTPIVHLSCKPLSPRSVALSKNP